MSDYTDEAEARLERVLDSVAATQTVIFPGGAVLRAADIRAALGENKRLREIKEYAERTHEKMRVEIERLRHHESASAQFLAERDDLRKELEKALAKLAEAEREVVRLNERLDKSFDAMTKRDAQMVEMADETSALKAEVERLRADYQGAEIYARCDRDEIRRLREENARLQAQISGRTLVPELVELQRDNARLRAKVERLREALVSIKKLVDEGASPPLIFWRADAALRGGGE